MTTFRATSLNVKTSMVSRFYLHTDSAFLVGVGKEW
jgi:hypothetical protein